MKLTPEIRETLRKKQLTNILQKLNAGGTLTAREQALLDQDEQPNTVFVASQEELAAACGVDRKTIGNTIRKFPKLLPGKKRGAESDGRYNVAAWQALLEAINVKGRGTNNPDVDFADERELRLREWKFKLESSEFKLEKAKGLLLPVAEFEACLGAMLSRFVAALNSMPGRAAGKILPRARAAVIRALQNTLDEKTFRLIDSKLPKDFAIDFADAEEILQSEVDLVKRTLQQGEYLNAPTDDEAE